MAYQTRYLAARAPDIALHVFRSRYPGRPLLRHLSTPVAWLAFVIGLLRHRIEIVHVNVAPRGSTWRKMLYAVTARCFGCKVILHLHGSGYDAFYAGLAPRRRALVRFFFHAADKVVVLSGFWRRFLIAELGVPETTIVEISNGVPAAAAPRAARGSRARPPSILFLGVVGYRKGIDVLIASLFELRQRGIAFDVIIGGNGEVAQASTRAAELGLSDAVRFLGWVDEEAAGRLLGEADIFVLPSRAENQPVSILEAMARAVPVVATTVGAIPEQVVDGETGLLVPPGEAVPLADALQRLIETPQTRIAMGEAGLRRFQAEFSVETSAQRLAALYRGLQACRPPAGPSS